MDFQGNFKIVGKFAFQGFDFQKMWQGIPLDSDGFSIEKYRDSSILESFLMDLVRM